VYLSTGCPWWLIVVVLLGDLAEGGIRRDTGVHGHNVEPSLLLLDLGEEAIQIGKARRPVMKT
jgi:hypothetical protein